MLFSVCCEKVKNISLNLDNIHVSDSENEALEYNPVANDFWFHAKKKKTTKKKQKQKFFYNHKRRLQDMTEAELRQDLS